MSDYMYLIILFSVYVIGVVVCFGYYNNKYGLDGADGIITTYGPFFWPIILLFKLIIAILWVPYQLGKNLYGTKK